MEKLREEHEAGLLTSMEFLKALLELAKDVAHVEKEVVPEEKVDKGKAALTSLFQNVKNDSTPIIVERIVNDIDGIVKIVRFSFMCLNLTFKHRQAMVSVVHDLLYAGRTLRQPKMSVNCSHILCSIR